MDKINDNYETVTCRICYEQCGRVYGAHLRKHGISSKEYKEKFPDAPLTPPKDKKNTSKNSGKHMKTEKYKKMFSEKFKGENNPMHKSNTTEQQRKEISPLSREFYKKRFPNITESEIDLKIKEVTDKVVQDRLLPSNKEYWIERGYNDKEAIKKVSERQTTFSKEICIEKYGEEEGIKIWKKRQKKWHNNYKKSNFSKISQELYISVWEKIKHEHQEVYFASLNEVNEIETNGKNYEYRLELDDKIILPDFFIPSINKILEFDGTYYHRPTPENKKREKERDESIIRNGYKVLHITEKEYNEDKDITIEKCISFIKQG